MTESSAPPQVIPRPASSSPGPPAPWADLPLDRRVGFTLDAVRVALTTPFERFDGPDAPRESAVLAALFEEEGETRVILTRRAATLRSHRSEVSFPGGRVEDGETLMEAGLRESWEEVGIESATVEVIGKLTPLATFSTGALIQPFVGLLAVRPELRPDPREVERAFDVSLADLLVDGVHRSELWGIAGQARDIHFFDLPEDIVWGATGRMLWELLAKVTGTLPAPPAEVGPLP